MKQQSLLVFADYVCPYCRLADAILSRLETESGVIVEAAAFELRPAGTVLPSVNESWMRDAWVRIVQPLAREVGIDMQYPSLIPRTRKAHEAVAFAQEQGAGAVMRVAVYDAYWQSGRDIGRIDVLMELAGSAGLDPAGMKVALDIDQWTDRVERDQAWAAQLGVRGVPAYLLGGRGAGPREGWDAAALRVGLQRYNELMDWVMVSHDV